MTSKIDYVELQSRASKFYEQWKTYSKNERKGAQSFLLGFMKCFGIDIKPEDFFEDRIDSGYADGYLKDVCLIEMKSPDKKLEEGIEQIKRYWKGKNKSVNFLIVSNFHSFLIIDTRDWTQQRLKLGELSNKISMFNFLIQRSPIFLEEQEEISKKAAKKLGELYKSLISRLNEEKENEIDIFILQSIFCMFAEDIGFLPYGFFTKEVEKVFNGEDNSANILAQLFKMMDESDRIRKQGRYQDVRYFNGPLFEKKPEIVLKENEIKILYDACILDWSKIRPEIFGVLFESFMSKDKRHSDGMHYTSEEDILKIVGPCIIDYWEEKIQKIKNKDDIKKVHEELLSYRVLDPACGSGNFLLVAYREIKKIELKLFHRYKEETSCSFEEAQKRLGHFSVNNMYGIEINFLPTLIAKLSLWITKKIIQEEYKLIEEDLPLESLKHISHGDALSRKWDDVNVVISNPPFLGCKQIRSVKGDDYFNWLVERFPTHNKMSDYCTYWYEKVFEDVKDGLRVGFVSTNTVTQTNSKMASLDKIYEHGGEIFNAISSQKWSGEAKVHVSIINFINKRRFEGNKYLDDKKVDSIASNLKSENKDDDIKIYRLSENFNIAFVGVVPNGKGFLLSEKEYEKIVLNDNLSKEVIHKYIDGKDINRNFNLSSSRYIIDFEKMELQDAKKYTKAFKIVKEKVKPIRDKVSRKKYREIWWRFAEEQMKMRYKLNKLEKFIITSRVSKHPIFTMIKNDNILPADSTVAIMSDDYYLLGVLQSCFHILWFRHQCSTLKSDLRYTNTTVFETFPFPKNSNEKIGEISKKIEDYKKNICAKNQIGLTTLYNELSEGGHEILKKLMIDLDKEVARSYGFPLSLLKDENEIISYLKKLNNERYFNSSKKEVV